MLRFLKNWTLPIAMLTGTIGYPFFSLLSPVTPYLIFAMLLLTFSKITPDELKPTRMHFWLLLVQLGGSIGVYLALYRFNPVVAQSAMVCVIAPTATAAAVITAKLGGSAASLTTYTLLGNIGTALAVPLLFPLVENRSAMEFGTAFLLILGKVFPLLIFPFLIAWFLLKAAPGIHRQLVRMNELAFYLWAVSLTIVTAKTVESLFHETADAHTELLIATAGLVTCALQFFIGKQIGSRFGDRISGGQALGQKNTVLAIWMAHAYLHPLAAVGPGSYVLWQNIFNSWQLWKKRRRETR